MANQKFDFKKPLLGASDEIVSDENGPVILNDFLSKIIMRSNINDSTIKFFDWALELVKSGILHLDPTDQDTLKKFIEKNPQLTVLVKGRLIELMKVA